MDSAELIARIEALEKRVLTLEAIAHKTSGLANAVKDIIGRWPGPFTAQQIRQAVLDHFPGLMSMEKAQSVESKIHRMVKDGLAICTLKGSGPHPSIYERVENPQPGADRPGTKRGARHSYESGFRSVVREAMGELPERFTLSDLQVWVAGHYPDLRVPEGSWSSTLYKLTELGELEVAKFGRRGKTLKEYRRTSKRVAPSGAELREVADAYQEFRRSFSTELRDWAPTVQKARFTA